MLGNENRFPAALADPDELPVKRCRTSSGLPASGNFENTKSCSHGWSTESDPPSCFEISAADRLGSIRMGKEAQLEGTHYFVEGFYFGRQPVFSTSTLTSNAPTTATGIKCVRFHHRSFQQTVGGCKRVTRHVNSRNKAKHISCSVDSQNDHRKEAVPPE